MIEIIREVIRQFKNKKREQVAAQNILDDPLTLELIERIASRYDFHFEIVRTDGTKFRFLKEGKEIPAISDDWKYY